MYADDGIIFSNSLEAIEEVKKLFALAGMGRLRTHTSKRGKV
jgi:hypothetical protein